MRVLPLALRRDPLDVLASLADEPGAFLVEVADVGQPLTLIGCAPHAVLRVRHDDAAPLETIADFVVAEPSDLPFPYGAVVGYLAYELGARGAPSSGLPLAVLARYDPMLAYDRVRNQYALVCRDPASARAPWLERLAAPPPRWDGPLAGGPLVPLVSPARQLASMRRILDYLAAGDAYQVNLTQPFAAPLAAPAWALFTRLAR